MRSAIAETQSQAGWWWHLPIGHQLPSSGQLPPPQHQAPNHTLANFSRMPFIRASAAENCASETCSLLVATATG